MLDEHNRARARHCAPALKWSKDVAAVAQRWAGKLRASGCAFDHSGGKYGENLAAGTSPLTPREVVAMWMGEEADYDYRKGTFGMKTGHFTQVVWRGSKELGCGSVECGGNTIWVCNYSPPGNVLGDFQENVRPAGCK